MDFFILGMPRSRTAWLSVFLTTDKTICHHDPMAFVKDVQCLNMIGGAGRITGVADTGLALFHQWVNRQEVVRVVIKRPVEEVCRSLSKIGLPTDGVPLLAHCLDQINADLTINFHEIDNFLSTLWDICTRGLPFDAPRAALLKTLNIQTTNVHFDAEHIRHLANEVQKGGGSCQSVQQ